MRSLAWENSLLRCPVNQLPVIVRELRAESRRPLNYWLRAVGAGALLGACLLAVLSHHSFIAAQQNFANVLRMNPGWFGGGGGAGVASTPQAMQALGSLLFGNANAALFVSLWVLVPLLTADSINREKREGTLGLLFLTPLTPMGVVTGKCFVHGLRGLTLFLTMLPILALPVLLGGISAFDVFMAALLDANALLLALAAGLLASCLARDPVRTVILAEAFSLVFATLFMGLHKWAFGLSGGFQVLAAGAGVGTWGLPGGGVIGNRGAPGSGLLTWFRNLLEFNTNLATFARDLMWGRAPRMSGPWSDFWTAAKPGDIARWFQAIAGLSCVSILSFYATVRLAAGLVRRSWQEAPPSPEAEALRKTYCEPRFWNAVFQRKRSRALARNPISWLQQYSLSARLTKWGWCLFIVIAECVLVTGWSEMSDAQLYLAAALLGGVAFAASSSFRQDRESGALELLLVTPLRAWQLMTGRLLGLWIQFFPAAVVLLSSWFFAARFLNVGRVWFEEVPMEFWAPVLFLSSYATMPAVGLLFSLGRRTLVGAWIQTCLLSLGFPLLILWGIRAIEVGLGLPLRSTTWAILLMVGTQGVTAALAAFLLPARLRRVAVTRLAS